MQGRRHTCASRTLAPRLGLAFPKAKLECDPVGCARRCPRGLPVHGWLRPVAGEGEAGAVAWRCCCRRHTRAAAPTRVAFSLAAGERLPRPTARCTLKDCRGLADDGGGYFWLGAPMPQVCSCRWLRSGQAATSARYRALPPPRSHIRCGTHQLSVAASLLCLPSALQAEVERRYPARRLADPTPMTREQRAELAAATAAERNGNGSRTSFHPTAVAHFHGFWMGESEDGAGDADNVSRRACGEGGREGAGREGKACGSAGGRGRAPPSQGLGSGLGRHLLMPNPALLTLTCPLAPAPACRLSAHPPADAPPDPLPAPRLPCRSGWAISSRLRWGMRTAEAGASRRSRSCTKTPR